MLERVWIDACNFCSIDTEHPENGVLSTKMWCGEQFDRPYYEWELDFVDGKASPKVKQEEAISELNVF